MGVPSVGILVIVAGLAVLGHQDRRVVMGLEDPITPAEVELQRMLSFVTPLMAIVRKDQRRVVKRSEDEGGRKLKKGPGRSDYGYGYEEHYEHCCDEKNDYLGLISLIALSLLGLFLIALLSTTAAPAGRKKRSEGDDENDLNFWLSQSHEDASRWRLPFFFSNFPPTFYLKKQQVRFISFFFLGIAGHLKSRPYVALKTCRWFESKE